jgi:16S rRNA (cytidine1402-2'-O)-methyltransferase
VTGKGQLYLLPSLLGDSEPLEVLPLSVKKIIDATVFFIVENEKSARQFIKKVLPSKNQQTLEIFVLNKYTPTSEYSRFIEPLERGFHIALVSEAGAPGIADPGAEIVNLVHERGYRVVPIVGPSSILLAMMASGMNGQNFAFSGYLPIEREQRRRKIKALESLSKSRGQSQIFMETPYRNNKLLQDILTVCAPATRLCIACEITLPAEFIRTQTILWWQNNLPDLEKRPAIFILHG